MRRSLLILLVACTLVVAMVPRHRRAQDTENGGAVGAKMYCAEQTPCFWSIYKSGFKNLIYLNVTNTYCICTASQTCSFSHEEEFSSTYVYRCKDDS